MSKVLHVAEEYQVDDLPLWRDPEAYKIVRTHLKRYDVSEEHLARLVAAYRDHAHKQRLRGLTEDIDSILMSDVE